MSKAYIQPPKCVAEALPKLTKGSITIKRIAMLEAKGLFALQYSPQGKDWRIDDLEVVLKRNLGWFAMGETGDDYKILAISDSRSQLRAFRRTLVNRMKLQEI